MAVVSVALAIASAALWGGADYLAGVSSRRMAVLAVTFVSQLAGLLTVGLLLLATGEPLSAAGALWGVGAGLVGAATLGVFYAALAGIVLIARRDDEALALTPRVLGLAAAAALGIGTVLALLQLGAGAEGSSGVGVVVAARASAVSLTGLALLATRTRLTASRGAIAPIAAVGVADTGANALFAVASEGGADALVAMLGSLYPVTTVLLARALLAERLTLRQGAGVALALAGAALVSTG